MRILRYFFLSMAWSHPSVLLLLSRQSGFSGLMNLGVSGQPLLGWLGSSLKRGPDQTPFTPSSLSRPSPISPFPSRFLSFHTALSHRVAFLITAAHHKSKPITHITVCNCVCFRPSFPFSFFTDLLALIFCPWEGSSWKHTLMAH